MAQRKQEGSLFRADPAFAPLAARMRPRTLEELEALKSR